MQVILLERIEKLGQMGDEVKVKDGFARNYLLPRRKALRATDANRAQFETKRVDLEAHNLKARDEAQSVADKMDGLSCTLIRQASEGGQLYGSVTSRDIAEAITESGFSVDRAQIVLDRVIKNLGIHDIRTQLHPEVPVTVKINVARSAEEADAQKVAAERGEAVASDSAGEAAAGEEAGEELHVEEFFEEEALEEVEAVLHEAEAEEVAEAEAEEVAEAEAGEAAEADAGETAEAATDADAEGEKTA